MSKPARTRVMVALLGVLVVLVTSGIMAAPVRAQPPAPAADPVFVHANCQPVWVSGSRMVFNALNADGHWDAFAGDTRCGHAQPLLPRWPGHRGASDVSPDGRYVLLETDYGQPAGQWFSTPGKGYANDLELLDRHTGRLTRLTTGRLGTIWARLKPDSTKVTWSQLVTDTVHSGDPRNYLLGIWELHVADLTPAGTLVHEKSWSRTGEKGFYETYGWLDNQIMFASDTGVRPKNPWGNWLSSQDWLIPESLSPAAVPQRVTPPFPTWWGGQENAYSEFMTPTPSGTFGDRGPWIFTSISHGSSGLDLWRIRPDGSGRQQLTFFNTRGYPTAQYSIVGGLAVDQRNPKLVYAGVSHDPNSGAIDAWRIRTH
jgi:hypothetical protein